MDLHRIPVTKETVEQFANYQDRNAKLLTQAQDMLKNLADVIEQMPEGPAKQEVLQELKQMLGGTESTVTTGQTMQSTTQKMVSASMLELSKNSLHTTASITAASAKKCEI